MPQSRSATKRVRQSKKRQIRNKAIKSATRTQMRKVTTAVEAGNAEGAQAELKSATQRLDRAVSKGILHKNAVARHKSRLARKVKALDKPAAE